MHILRNLLLVCALASAQITQAQVFDQKRAGVLIGLGAGAHVTETQWQVFSATKTENGVATSLKLGWGVSEKFTVYYTREASWFNSLATDGFTTRKETFLIGITGIGASYYFPKSVYILGAIGLGDISAPLATDIRADTGSAFILGAGYELDKKLQLEFKVLSTNLDNDRINQSNLKTSSALFAINYLWY